jgi:outer membrane immunogenic protein
MKKLLIGSFVALTMGGSAAIAADMPLKAPPPVAVFSWTGCYVGIEGGGAWGRSKHRSLGVGEPFDYTPWFDVSGGLAGVEYGCNQQFGGNWVFGIESDWSWSSKKGSSLETGALGVALGTTSWSDETREKWVSTSRMRVGWTWDRLWLYVTGGFAAAKVQANVTIGAIPGVVLPVPIGTVFSDSKTLYGWTAGAGAEYAFWNNWSVKAEYLYVRLETQAYQFGGAIAQRGSIPLDDHIFRVGLNWRFTECVFGSCGGPAPAPIYTK